jgi:hypothetical protein
MRVNAKIFGATPQVQLAHLVEFVRGQMGAVGGQLDAITAYRHQYGSASARAAAL